MKYGKFHTFFADNFWKLPLAIYKYGKDLLFDMFLPFFRFRRSQDKNVKGISFLSRDHRKNRNLVTIKFNMINWILETASTLILLVFINKFITLLYILINSCGTPMVYFMGIEDNRKKAKENILMCLKKISITKEIQPEWSLLIDRGKDAFNFFFNI